MSRKSILRVLSLALALLMVVGVLSACSDPVDPNKDKPVDDDPSKKEEDKPTLYKADIPAGVDYNQEEFMIYAYPEDVFVWKDYDWQNNGYDGDRIGEAVYKRTEQVNEELNVKINHFNCTAYGDPSEFRNAVATGDDVYDVGNLAMLQHITMVQSGYLQELNEYGCIDLDAPWWDQNILKDLSVMGMNFCLVGDIGTMYKRSIACILFNKELHASKQGLANPYELVADKLWTLDELVIMGMEISEDMDGNDKYDDQDRYGMIYFTDVLCALEIGSNVQFAAKNSDDIPEMTLNDPKTVDVIDIASDLLYDTTMSYNVTANSQDEKTMYTIFMDNRALFYYGELHSAEDMRAMETDFGILPIPMYDTEQEDYRHTVNPVVAAVYVIPMTNMDETRTSYVLDALGAASKNILTPAYYDVNLKGVTSRDDESEMCLDVIIGTMAYDMGYLYVREAGDLFRTLCNKRSNTFASEYGSKESALQKKIDDIVDAVALNN